MKKKYLISVGLLAFLLFWSSMFQVKIGEHAAQVRFGKIIRIVQDGGAYFKLPFDQIVVVRPDAIQRFELGFRSDLTKKTFTDKDTEPQLWELKHVSITKQIEESLIITSDENIVDANTVIHYQVSDVKKYLISLADPKKFILHVAESTLRETFGKQTLEAILVKGKRELQDELKSSIQESLDGYEAGVKIVSVNLQDVHPPVEVVHSFRDVTSAREDKNTKIYQAIDYKAKVIPGARGRAARDINTAESYREEKVMKSSGDLARFFKMKRVYGKYSSSLKYRKFYDAIAESYTDKKLYIVSPKLFENIDMYSSPAKGKVELESSDDIY